MKIQLMANMFKRTFDKRNMSISVIAILICSIASLLYASMQRVNNVNYVLLVLCGGLKGEIDFAILFAIWIVLSILMAFLSGTALDCECKRYQYIAPRYGSQNRWMFHLILNTVIRSICYSVLLITIGVLVCLLHGGVEFSPLSPSLLEQDAASFQYWMYDKHIPSALLAMTMLRFVRIGLIMLCARMIPKYHVQVGFMAVLMIEMVSFVNTKGYVFLFTYYSACSAGIPLSFACITSVAEIFCIVGIGIARFRIKVQNGQI